MTHDPGGRDETGHTPANPIVPFLERQGVVVLDGGLATALEARGCALDDDLWSAKILLESPETIREVHLEFLRAGADCITTASYQATLPGFMNRGLTEAEGAAQLRFSVQLAVEARNDFWSKGPRGRRLKPLVAASVGPYGAFLADGSEYTGRYDLDEDGLYAFHRERWHLLAISGADLLACETIPSLTECRALLRLLRETPEVHAWISFSCRDGQSVSDGTPFTNVVRECSAEAPVIAVGINCTSPTYVASLVTLARAVTHKPICVYPNRGEQYDAANKIWSPGAEPIDFLAACAEWRRLGASLIGGCCRIGPEEISGLQKLRTV